jgi:flagellin
MAVVNTNVGASVAQAALMKNSRELSSAMEQLSTGRRINSAADDASGLAITNRMTAQINGLGAAIRNANDANSMVSTAEGALEEITDMLQRMRELAVSVSGTTTSDDRTYLNNEFSALRSEIQRIAENTEWNGNTVLDGTAGNGTGLSAVNYQIGVDGGDTIEVTFGNFLSGGATMTSLQTATLAASSAASGIALASTAMTTIDTAIEAVSNQRSAFGAASNRMTHAVDNLTNVKTNAEASRSQILDTDYADATAELARTQIIQQAGTAMLAQANQLPQTVLALLQ